VLLGSVLSTLFNPQVPVGSIYPTALFSAPGGYLMMDGTAYSRTTYANLFNAITLQPTGTVTSGSATISAMCSTANIITGMRVSGTCIPAGAGVSTIGSGTVTLTANATCGATGTIVFARPDAGIGDGSTTFNVPDWRGRTVVGSGSGAGLTARYAGQVGGAETHTQTTGEVGSHTHSVYDPGHSHSIGPYVSRYGTNGIGTGGAPYWSAGDATSDGATGYTSTVTTGISIYATGAPTAMNIMNPYAVANWMIKY